MKLTGRTKWGIATVAIPITAFALLYVYATLPEEKEVTPPATGEVRTIPPSWFDRALSFYYEKTTDEPIVAIIRQDVQAQIGAISPGGQFIATGGSIIRDVAISSIAENRIVRKLAVDSGNVNAIAFSPDGRYLATGRGFMANRDHNLSVHIWDMERGELIRKLPGPADQKKSENDVTALAFSPDSRTLAVSYVTQHEGDSVYLFDVETGKRLRVIHPSGLAHQFLTFFDGGRYLGYEEDGFNIYEVRTGKRVQVIGEIGIYAPSPDGRHLAMRPDYEQNLKILDRCTGREVKVLQTGKGYYRLLAFSPDGKFLAVHSDDGLLLWDLSAGKVVRQLKGHPDVVGHWIGFDAAGKYFAAVCNRYVVVWDFEKLISTEKTP